ncbi:hypothetical protein Tco_0721714 [Tanacetum coccineum]
MGYYFYFPPENKVVVAMYAEFLEKNLISQEVNGRVEELEEIQDKDTSPSENTSEIPMEVEEVEEHSLGDLNESNNYKAAILDLESDNSKQSTTAMSATEAEYIAASETVMEAVWIRKFISGLGGGGVAVAATAAMVVLDGDAVRWRSRWWWWLLRRDGWRGDEDGSSVGGCDEVVDSPENMEVPEINGVNVVAMT